MPVLSYIIALIRAFLLLFGMLIGLLIFYVGLPFVDQGLSWGIAIRGYWVRWAVWVLNIKISCTGSVPPGAGLVVCNHISMMDPVIMLHLVPHAHPLSKAELAAYPIIGHGARATGVLFVHRRDDDSRAEAKDAIREGLKNGQCILVFPEGTVSDGKELLPFKPGSFHMAAGTGQSIYPVCIRYTSERDIWREDDSLWAHFRTQFGKWETRVHLHFGPPRTDDSGEALRMHAKKFIGEALRLQE